MSKTRKRPLSAWNLFVQKVKKENPAKSFKEVLLLASSLKKKGKMPTNLKATGKKKK
jgi:hypothetical protein